MKTKIIRIGNSQGVRIPKPLLDEAGLGDEVELRVTDRGLSLERLVPIREGWAEAAAELSEREEVGDDTFTPTDFDAEWEW